MSDGALSGIRVLDLTRVLAGPYCTMLMADMGAEVIKIETPGAGDDSRQFGPFINNESSYYMNLNRNKKGVTLNLKKAEAKKLFLDMVTKADVVVENYRPGTMEKLGLGYDILQEVNPKIIYGAISGFGHYGPYKDRAGYDLISQAMSGIMSTTGWPGGDPTRSGTAIGDVLGGLSVLIGILSAIESRHKTGLGQKVDVALVDSVVSSLQIFNQIYLVEGRLPGRIGNRYESSYPYDSFRANDGILVIGAGNDKLWRKLCEVMNNSDLIKDERFNNNPKRIQNHSELKDIIEAWASRFKVDEAVGILLNAGIPSAPIYSIEEVIKDPHIAEAREMFIEVEHPIAGKFRMTGNHIKMSGTKMVISPAPLLGQHNIQVFGELLNLSEEQLVEMHEQGII